MQLFTSSRWFFFFFVQILGMPSLSFDHQCSLVKFTLAQATLLEHSIACACGELVLCSFASSSAVGPVNQGTEGSISALGSNVEVGGDSPKIRIFNSSFRKGQPP